MGSQVSSCVEEAAGRGGREVALPRAKAKEKEAAAAAEELAARLPGLEVLEARGCKLSRLPYEVAGLTRLVVLDLGDNRLSSLPSLTPLPRLRELRLPGNRFSAFPAVLVDLEGLEALDLSANLLPDLPRDVAKMKALRSLLLAKNAITGFPAQVCGLRNLTALDLSENKVPAVPQEVGKLGRLEQLLLRRNTIVSIPEELCECQELRTLDLSENQLQALPRSIGRLAQLTSLSLQHNKIAELPAEIGALRGMKVLKLHDNMLAALPHSIGQLSNLMELCLQENELTELPLELGQCTSLRKLYAEYNKLSTLPAEMRNLNKLVVLILHHNQLSEVPEVLLGMKQLLRLSLDNNPLKEEEAQEVIRTKGALALLQGRGEGSGSTIRATIRGNSPAGTPRPLSPLLPPGLSRTSSQQWRKSLSVTSAFGPEGDLTASNPTPTAAGLKDAKSLARVSSYTSDRLRSMAGPAQVTSPEDEMKRFVENRRRLTGRSGSDSYRGRSGTVELGDIGRGALDSEQSGSTIRPSSLRTHSEEASPTQVRPSKSEEENIPSYSKFKFAFDRLLTQQDFSSRRQETLKKLPPNQKWKLLTQYKGSTLDMLREEGVRPIKQNKTKSATVLEPPDFCQILKGRPNAKEVGQLLQHIETQPPSWTAQFIETGGIDLLVGLISAISMKLYKTLEDADVVLSALSCLKHLLGMSLRSVLTTSDSVNCVALSLCFDSLKVRQLALEVLATVLDVHFIGQRLVQEAFNNYQKQIDRDSGSRFKKLMEPLLQDEPPIDMLVNTMDIINAIIGEEEDLERRLDIRKEFVQMGIIELIDKLRLFDSELLHIQLDLFEQELEQDYEEMLSKFEKKKVLERVEGGQESESLRGNYLRILVGHTGQQLIVPFEPTTTVATTMETILLKHPVASGEQQMYGLWCGGAWLDDASRLVASYGLSGESIAEFKLKPWTVSIQQDECEQMVILDPNVPVATILQMVIEKFALHDHVEEYGLFLSSADPAGGTDGKWLEDTKRLGEYLDIKRNGKAVLKKRPWTLKVTFTGQSVEELRFDPGLTVSSVTADILQRILGSQNVLSVDAGDYGLLALSKKRPKWLKPNRTLLEYGARKVSRVELRMRPKSVTILLPARERVMKIQFSEPVHDVLAHICQKASLDPCGYSLYLRKPTQQGSGSYEDLLLNPAASLREQNVPFRCILVLGKLQTHVNAAVTERTLTSIWDEPHGVEFVHYDSESGAVLRAGTLNKLVERLTSETGIDKAYEEAFVMTFQSFTTAEELLTKLIERFRVPPDREESIIRKIQMRVCLAMREWIQGHYRYLNFPNCDHAQRIMQFIESDLIPKGHKEMAALLKKAISHPPSKAVLAVTPPALAGKPKMKNMSDKITLFDIDELELARQLTYRTWALYSKIEPIEFFGSAWSKPKLHHLAPNLLAIIDHFNRISSWVATIIVETEKVRERAKILARCIKIAQCLRELNNYHLLTAFISGINNSALLRLKWTRAKLPKRTLALLSDLEGLMSMEGSFKNYRAALEASSPPCIPYVGVYLTDLTFIEDGNADEVDGLINFAKRTLVYGIVSTIQRYQQVAYAAAPLEEVQRWLDTMRVLSDNDLYARSLVCEPRGASRGDIN